ncbi:hypothetical protein P7C70_g6817, partial [Phenoliferia sp. Uapishka_3]
LTYVATEVPLAPALDDPDAVWVIVTSTTEPADVDRPVEVDSDRGLEVVFEDVLVAEDVFPVEDEVIDDAVTLDVESVLVELLETTLDEVAVVDVLAALTPRNRDPALIRNLTGAPTHLDRIKLLADSDFTFDFSAAIAGAPRVSTGKPRKGWCITVKTPTPVKLSSDLVSLLVGHTVSANAGTMPALSGLGVSMTAGFIGPCGMNTPQTHPRGTDSDYVISANFVTGMFAENGAKVVLGNVGPNQVRFAFIAAFSDEDVGTLQIAQGTYQPYHEP